MAVPALVLAGLYLRYRHQPLPVARSGRPGNGWARLPLSCWLLAALVAVGMAVEFCVVYFGAELLTASGLGTAQAATAMSGFYAGILAGRAGADAFLSSLYLPGLRAARYRIAAAYLRLLARSGGEVPIPLRRITGVAGPDNAARPGGLSPR